MNQSCTDVPHKSVLVSEVLEYLDPQPGKLYLDVTFGAGGHTRAILEHEPTCKVIALDWDQESLEHYGVPMQEEFGDRLQLVWGNFALLYKILKKEKIKKVDGILADFGTSQMQITDRAGFSVYRDTPLDMRMSFSHQRLTAAELVNQSTQQVLEKIFWTFGNESHARTIAKMIIEERQKKPITTTKQLAQLVEKTIPFMRKRKIHPATKIFQALRIYINKELDNIGSFLHAVIPFLKPGGRVVCISFHSLEDRIVKNFFKEQEGLATLEIITPKVVTATEEEVACNPSSRSACLRVAQRC